MTPFLIAATLAGEPDALTRALAHREGPRCEVEAWSGPALRDALLARAEHPDAIGAVPAAGCLVERYADDPVVGARFEAWASDPDRVGLTFVVLSALDRLPAPLADRVADAALATPDPRWRARFHTLVAGAGRPTPPR